MNDVRLTPLAGVLSVVLFVVAVFVIESGDIPGDEATGAELAAYLSDSLGRLAVAMVLWGVGTIALTWFLDGLRTRIAAASDRLGRLSFALGFATALFALASFAPDVAGALAADNLDRELEGAAAEAISALGDGFFIAAELLLAGFLFTVGLAAITTRVLPAWLGWISLVLAVVALIPPIGWAVLAFAYPLWILLVAALLWRDGDAGARAEAFSAQ